MSRGVDLLIMGGTGPIGEAVARRATESGRSVLSASRRGPHTLDVRDDASLERTFREAKAPAMIYLVGVSKEADGVQRSVEHLKRAVRVAVRHGAERVMFASSAAVYGDTSPHQHHETDSLSGQSSYAMSKIRCERELSELSRELGVSTVSLRIFNVFGKGCGKSLVNRLVLGPPPTLHVTTSFVRDYVHVDDVANAIVAAVERPGTTGAVNVCRGIGVSNASLVGAADPRSYVRSQEAVRSFSIGDPTRANSSLDWTPSRDPLLSIISRTGF